MPKLRGVSAKITRQLFLGYTAFRGLSPDPEGITMGARYLLDLYAAEFDDGEFALRVVVQVLQPWRMPDSFGPGSPVAWESLSASLGG